MIASYVYNGVTYTVEVERLPDGAYRAVIDGQAIPFRALPTPTGGTILVIGDERVTTHVVRAGNERHVAVGGDAYALSLPERRGSKRGGSSAGGGDLAAQMPGQVREIMAAEGDVVQRGQPILLLEAMKMEIRVTAPADGTLKRLLVKVGDVVERGQRLAEIS